MFKEINEIDVAEYLNIELDEVNIKLLKTLIISAKAYISSYTGRSIEFIDNSEDLVMALYVLVSEMYENRLFTVENNKVNPIIKSILDMHSINLLYFLTHQDSY